MKVAIIQSNYLPWKGYFDIIHDVDVFVFEDDLQYTVRDWRNRNRFKTTSGTIWLTVPVNGGRSQAIDEVAICYETDWVHKHLETMKRSYCHAPGFALGMSLIEEPLQANIGRLSLLNRELIVRISRFLGIKTRFLNARDFGVTGKKDDRLIQLCRQIGANSYLSGPAAHNYIQPEKFQQAGIELLWKNYAGYPEYEQNPSPFEHGVSIMDLIFRTGEKAVDYIWKWREKENTGEIK